MFEKNKKYITFIDGDFSVITVIFIDKLNLLGNENDCSLKSSGVTYEWAVRNKRK